MKKIGVFLLFVVCTFTGKVWAASTLNVNPSQMNMQPGETKTIDILSSSDEKIIEGSMTIVTTSKYISLVSVTMEPSLASKNTGSTTTFSTKKALSKGDKIGTVTIQSTKEAPLGTVGTISIGSISFKNQNGKVIEEKNVLSTITIAEEKKSTIDTLQSLTSSYAEIPFAVDTYSYSITVGNEIKKMDLVAKASDEKATVEISNQNLEVGKNKIVITVLSESGSKKEYTVEVVRKEATEEVVPKKSSNISYIVVLLGSILIIMVDLFYIYKHKN